MTEVIGRLPEQASSFVEAQVAAGRFASASEFLLSLVDEARRRTEIERLDQRLIEGLNSGPGEEATPQWVAMTRHGVAAISTWRVAIAMPLLIPSGDRT